MALALYQQQVLNGADQGQHRLPREVVIKAMKAVCDLGEKHFPKLVLKNKVMATFMEMAERLPEIQSLHLCPQHVANKVLVVRKMCGRALSHYITAVNQNFIRTKKRQQEARKNRRKHKNMTHQ